MKKYRNLLLLVAIIILTGCSTNSEIDLTCTKIYDDNSEQIFYYSFESDKVYSIKITLTIPETEMSGVESYKTEFLKINDVDGCNGSFITNEDNSFTTIQSCELSKMSDSSIKSLFLIDREAIEISRKEVIANYYIDSQVTCN